MNVSLEVPEKISMQNQWVLNTMGNSQPSVGALGQRWSYEQLPMATVKSMERTLCSRNLLIRNSSRTISLGLPQSLLLGIANPSVDLLLSFCCLTFALLFRCPTEGKALCSTWNSQELCSIVLPN